MEFKIDKKEVKNLFLFVLLAIAFYWFLHETERVKSVWAFLSSIFAPFVIGAAFAFILNVPMRFFESKLRFIKNKRWLRISALLATVLAVIMVVALVVVLLIPQIEETVGLLISQLPGFFQKVNEQLNELFETYPEIKELLGLNANGGQIEWMKLVEKLMTFLETSISTILGSAVSLVSNLTSAIFNAVISMVFMIYCLMQKETLVRNCRKLLYATMKEKHADEIIRIARMINSVFSNFITGQSMEAVILGLLFVPAMAILRMPYIPLICVVIAVTALVPLVGAFVGCVLGAFFILVNDPMQAVTFVIMFLVVQQIEGNVIYPKVVGKSVGLPGMWVLLAVAVGGGVMGVGGMLFMVPLTSVIYTLLKEYANKRVEKREISEEKLTPHPPELQPHFVFKSKKSGSKNKSKKTEEVK